MKRVTIERNVSSKLVLAPVARALNDASILFPHDVSFTNGVYFSIDDAHFPRAREIFEMLKEDVTIDNFKVEAN